MKKVIIEYYNIQDELLMMEEKEIEEGSYLDTIIDKATDPFINPHYFSNEAMHEIDDEPIATEYVIVKEVVPDMKEVVIEYYGNDGVKFKEEFTGAVEGSLMYDAIGKLINPWLDEDEIFDNDDILVGTEFCIIREKENKDDINFVINKLKELSEKENKTFVQRALKLSEETGEVAEAVLSYMDAPGCGYKKKTEEDVIEECIDVIIMASSIIFKTAAEDPQILNTFTKKLSKWESKMTE